MADTISQPTERAFRERISEVFPPIVAYLHHKKKRKKKKIKKTVRVESSSKC
jgi:hypothetical protein